MKIFTFSRISRFRACFSSRFAMEPWKTRNRHKLMFYQLLTSSIDVRLTSARGQQERTNGRKSSMSQPLKTCEGADSGSAPNTSATLSSQKTHLISDWKNICLRSSFKNTCWFQKVFSHPVSAPNHKGHLDFILSQFRHKFFPHVHFEEFTPSFATSKVNTQYIAYAAICEVNVIQCFFLYRTWRHANRKLVGMCPVFSTYSKPWRKNET